MRPGTSRLPRYRGGLESSKIIAMVLLREALFPSGSEEKLMFVLRAFVTKIIDFCEEDLEAWTRLLSTGSLNL